MSSEAETTQVLAGRDDRVLLAGIARSGTSWLIRALARSENTRHYYEPDNVDADPTGHRPPSRQGFGPYPVLRLGESGEPFRPVWDAVFAGRLPRRKGLGLVAARAVNRLPAPIRDPLVNTTARALIALPGGPARTVVKTIYGVFSLDWLVDRYQPRVLLLQRNPLNMVASWREVAIPTFDLATRRDIQDFYLEHLGVPLPAIGESELARIAWHVGLLTTVLGEAAARHPEWLVINHEDLCVDPINRVHQVFDRLGLPWTEEAARFLAENNRPGTGFEVRRVAQDQPDRWRKRLSEAEVDEISEVLAGFPTGGWVRPPSPDE